MHQLRRRSAQKPQLDPVEEHQLISDAIRKGLTVQAHNQARAHRVRARDMLPPLLDRFGVKYL